jgi:hypothetical protein
MELSTLFQDYLVRFGEMDSVLTSAHLTPTIHLSRIRNAVQSHIGAGLSYLEHLLLIAGPSVCILAGKTVVKPDRASELGLNKLSAEPVRNVLDSHNLVLTLKVAVEETRGNYKRALENGLWNHMMESDGIGRSRKGHV